MNQLTWAPALMLAFGLLILVCCAIVIWPRKGRYLQRPHPSARRAAFRDQRGVTK